MRRSWPFIFVIFSAPSWAMEIDVDGLLDLRINHSDGLSSFVDGGQGKLQHSNGSDFSLAQLGLSSKFLINDQISLNTVINGFSDQGKDELGFTELFLKYRSIPNQNGFRSSARVGLFYPAISLENNATAWSSPNTLTPSTMNSWIGEELRATGVEYTAEWLGKFRDRPYDIKLNGTLFFHNDTAGAMISWHGWALSSRQTVVGETLPLPLTPALETDLSEQSRFSDPFHEEDDRPGYMASIEWSLSRKGLLQFGYFDSNTTPYSVTNGQYGWHTRFLFSGMNWKLSPQWHLQAQIMRGDTLMQSPDRIDVVNNDYRSAYLSIGWKQGKHRINTRIEEFSVTDNDLTVGDNNNEYGKAVTLSHRYRLDKQWFLLTEYNWINSSRAARNYSGEDPKQLERQLQLGVRYYF